MKGFRKQDVEDDRSKLLFALYIDQPTSFIIHLKFIKLDIEQVKIFLAEFLAFLTQLLPGGKTSDLSSVSGF